MQNLQTTAAQRERHDVASAARSASQPVAAALLGLQHVQDLDAAIEELGKLRSEQLSVAARAVAAATTNLAAARRLAEGGGFAADWLAQRCAAYATELEQLKEALAAHGLQLHQPLAELAAVATGEPGELAS